MKVRVGQIWQYFRALDRPQVTIEEVFDFFAVGDKASIMLDRTGRPLNTDWMLIYCPWEEEA